MKRITSLLLVIMLLTSIPVFQTSVGATAYTEAQLLNGMTVTETINMSDYAEEGIQFTKLKADNAELQSWDTSGVFTSNVEYLEASQTYEFKAKEYSSKTTSLVASSEGLVFSHGNRKRYGSTVVPDKGDGGIYTPRTTVRWNDRNDLWQGGAVKVTAKLHNQYSRGGIEFVPNGSSSAHNDDTYIDVIFDTKGFTIGNNDGSVVTTAPYEMEVDTFYDIVIRREASGFGIYAKKQTDADYTFVTVYDVTYKLGGVVKATIVGVTAALPSGDTVLTDIVKDASGNLKWVPANTDPAGATMVEENVTAYMTMSQVTFEGIVVYDDPNYLSNTYTEEQLLTGMTADKALTLSDYIEDGINFNALKGSGAELQNWDTSGVFTSNVEYLEASQTYEFTAKDYSKRTTSLVASSEGLVFSHGNRKRYGSTVVPDKGDGGIYTPRTIVRWNDVNNIKEGGAVKITAKLNNQYSRGGFDFVPNGSSSAHNDDTYIDVIFDTKGFTIGNNAGSVVTTIPYAMAVNTYYDIVIKKETNGYGIYAKKEADTNYFYLATYNVEYSAGTIVGITAAMPSGDTVQTDIVKDASGALKWVPADTDPAGAEIVEENVTAYKTMSQVTFKSIKTFDDPNYWSEEVALTISPAYTGSVSAAVLKTLGSKAAIDVTGNTGTARMFIAEYEGNILVSVTEITGVANGNVTTYAFTIPSEDYKVMFWDGEMTPVFYAVSK